MHKLHILLLSIGLLLASSSLHAQSSFGLFLGLSTPSDQINNVYNNDFITAPDFAGRMQRDAASLGYHGGVRLRFGLSEEIVFSGGISWSRFPQSKIRVAVATGTQLDSVVGELTTVQNVIPVAAGMNYYLIRKSIGIYATGELTYNYISSTIDATVQGTPVPIAQSPTYNRVGVGFGAGALVGAGAAALVGAAAGWIPATAIDLLPGVAVTEPSPVAAEFTRAGSPESASFTAVISPSAGA